MTSDRWHQIEELYHAALKLEPSARAGFLEEGCSGDAELRREVESLLAADAQAQDFIESPALETLRNDGRASVIWPTFPVPDAGTGTKIAPHQRRAQLDRGVEDSVATLPAGCVNGPLRYQRRIDVLCPSKTSERMQAKRAHFLECAELAPAL